MRKFIMKVENWVMGDESTFIAIGKFFLIFGLAVSIIIVPIIYFVNGHNKTIMAQCINSGNLWGIIGQHMEYRYNAATETSIPTTVTDYGCFKRQ